MGSRLASSWEIGLANFRMKDTNAVKISLLQIMQFGGSHQGQQINHNNIAYSIKYIFTIISTITQKLFNSNRAQNIRAGAFKQKLIGTPKSSAIY